MIILYWTVRGIDNVDTKIALKNFFNCHKPLLIFVAEPMIAFESVPPWYWDSIGVSKYCVNGREILQPNLWALWGREVSAIVMFISDQCIALEISCHQSTVYVAAVYASTFYLKRRQLWAELTNLQGCFQGPWLFIGDFNAVLGAHEKRRRRPPPPLSCIDFMNWSNANLLHHLPTLGAFYTWSNGRLGSDNVALRLDRAICNEEWVNFWRSSSCSALGNSALVRHQSDHHPLLMSMDFCTSQRSGNFKFFKTWTEHEDCRRIVAENWSKHTRGHGMTRLQAKLKHMKQVFRHWNRTVFGDVDRKVRMAVEEVNRIQQIIDSVGFSDQLYAQELEAHLILTKALHYQDELWREKLRDQRFIHGDRNTAYFHRISKVRATKNTISFLQDGDAVITDPARIEVHVLNYFQAIFSVDNSCIQNDLVVDTIPSLVSNVDNNSLLRLPLWGEVKNAVFTLNGDGAPGPNGFGGHFYQTYWDIVGADVIQSVQDFFISGQLAQNINSNLIVLIPKVPGARVMGDYRPIALANFQFKIISKILADRLADITMRIISVEQRGFIRDRDISKCVILASEAINLLEKRQYGGNVALKVDIAKAFDTLDWNFLLAVLQRFGFDEKFVHWILVILQSARLSVLVNGKAVGFFTCSHGVRQGDPLSPLLFCLVEEVLSRALSMAATDGQLIPMSYCRGVSFPTHILYADDVLIFCTGTKRNIRRLIKIFSQYSEVSGQLINNAKSRFFTSAMTGSRVQMISSLLGFNVGSLPFTYLGCPIFRGKPKVCTVSWKILCRPWSEGGLDIKSTRLINNAAMLKLAWNLLSSNSQWAVLLKRRFFSQGQPIRYFVKSSVWHGVKNHMSILRQNKLWIVGTGDRINLWTNNWLGEPLVTLFNIDPFFHASFTGKVSEVIVNGNWDLPASLLVPEVTSRLASITLPRTELPDSLVWTHSADGQLTSKHAVSFLRNAFRFQSQLQSIQSAKARIHSLIAMSGNVSTGKCLHSDSAILEEFSVSPRHRKYKDIILVLWKNPSPPLLKVNTDGSVVGGLAACGGLFRDSSGSFLGAFSCNIGLASVFHAETLAFILALEHAAHHGWRNLWLESDSTSALMIFSNSSLVQWLLRNRWHNAQRLGIQVISSHILHEGNRCADNLANMGHGIQGSIWLETLPTELHLDFYRDRIVNGHTYDTFHEACSALGLLDDDREFIDGITENCELGLGNQLRWLFVHLLTTSTMTSPDIVWDATWQLLSDGILLNVGSV
uniref:RNA-directed DNA polymerase (Reverse transcriptase); Ribonuclease H; Endonuclease/exonuclease/phosphatase n=1 Tax=Medicago truncatula TaxID=3880 RepID=Q1RU93_MEDTR|nr:RNA-directed DNA polymerase (Reverse transcriptase); Ribonuclease H; Endonuclease/exonuclease/phosphatase [Medicago truncatula]